MSKEIDNFLERYYLAEKIEDFDHLLELYNVRYRNIYLSDVEASSGMLYENIIRFYNNYDNDMKIPIEKRQPIKFYIDSPGGDLTSTFTIVDTIELSDTPIYTINTGAAYSGGFLIFISGHKRIAYPNSSFMLHEGSIKMEGDAGKFQDCADFYRRERNRLKNIVLKYTKISAEEYESHKKDDWWIDTEEAIKLGIIDEVSGGLII